MQIPGLRLLAGLSGSWLKYEHPLFKIVSHESGQRDMHPKSSLKSLLFSVTLLLVFVSCKKEPGKIGKFEPLSNSIESDIKPLPNGQYRAQFDLSGGTDEFSLSISQDSAISKFTFEGDLVRLCRCKAEITMDAISRNKCLCEFLRSEEPQPPAELSGWTSKIKVLSPDSIEYFATEADELLVQNQWIKLGRID